MPRCHGSYIGHVPEPDDSAASGIWRACDARELLADGKWPSQPAVPGAPTGAAGDEQVVLTWPAITTSPSVTDYGIQYSSDSGATWTTFTDSVSNATTATVTGLTNGTAYVFRLYGINALGDGPYGAASAAVTPVEIIPSLLLLKFDGDDGDTETVDSSIYMHSVALVDSSQLTDSPVKFGSTSGDFVSNGGYAEATVATTGTAHAFGTGDFTVEGWFYFTGEENAVLASGYTSSVCHWVFYWYGNLTFLQSASPNTWEGGLVAAPTSRPVGEWVHLAYTRQDGIGRIFQNGTLLEQNETQPYGPVTTNIPGVQKIAVASMLENGTSRTTTPLYADDVRVVKGTAAYTANFTPPTAPF